MHPHHRDAGIGTLIEHFDFFVTHELFMGGAHHWVNPPPFHSLSDPRELLLILVIGLSVHDTRLGDAVSDRTRSRQYEPQLLHWKLTYWATFVLR